MKTEEFVRLLSLWQNGFRESIDGKLRDELLDCGMFSVLFGARGLADSVQKAESSLFFLSICAERRDSVIDILLNLNMSNIGSACLALFSEEEMMKLIWISLIAMVMALGCSSSGDGDDSTDAATFSVTMNCSLATECQSSGADGETARVAISQLPCTTYASGQISAFTSVYNEAASDAISCPDTSNCNASFEDTVADIEIDSGSYSVIAFYDTDGDGLPSSGEATNCEDDVDWTGDSSVTVTFSSDWSDR